MVCGGILFTCTEFRKIVYLLMTTENRMDYNHEDDLEFFKANQKELVKQYDGKQLVIRKCDVVAAFDTVGEAFDYGCKNYGAGNFSIQLCVAGECAYTCEISTVYSFLCLS